MAASRFETLRSPAHLLEARLPGPSCRVPIPHRFVQEAAKQVGLLIEEHGGALGRGEATAGGPPAGLEVGERGVTRGKHPGRPRPSPIPSAPRGCGRASTSRGWQPARNRSGRTGSRKPFSTRSKAWLQVWFATCVSTPGRLACSTASQTASRVTVSLHSWSIAARSSRSSATCWARPYCLAERWARSSSCRGPTEAVPLGSSRSRTRTAFSSEAMAVGLSFRR